MPNNHIEVLCLIDRTKYLQMCRDCAMLKEEKYHMRHDVPDRIRVVYGGVEYYPVSYTLKFDNFGNTKHIATIHDLKANCVHDVLLKDITAKLEE